MLIPYMLIPYMLMPDCAFWRRKVETTKTAQSNQNVRMGADLKCCIPL